RHRDVLQGVSRGGDQTVAADQLGLRHGDRNHRDDLQDALPDLRGADFLLWPGLRGGEEDRPEGRHHGDRLHLLLQSPQAEQALCTPGQRVSRRGAETHVMKRWTLLLPLACCLAVNLALLITIALCHPDYLRDYRLNPNPDATDYVLLGRNIFLHGQF